MAGWCIELEDRGKSVCVCTEKVFGGVGREKEKANTEPELWIVDSG